MSLTRNIVTKFVFCLMFAHAQSVTVVETNNAKYECPDIANDMRKDCGFPGITGPECIERACCYKPTNTAGVPWCYMENFVETTTTLPKTTTTIAPTTEKPIPDWIKALMNASTDITAKKSSPNNSPSSELPLLTREIRNELMCQNTYRLFKKIRGASKCQSNLNNRVSCIARGHARKAGESECEACTNLNCCYDPVVKTIGGKRVPHCFKIATIVTTTTIPTTAKTETPTTSTAVSVVPKKIWEGIRPQYQPGSPPRVSTATGNIGGGSLLNGLSNVPGFATPQFGQSLTGLQSGGQPLFGQNNNRQTANIFQNQMGGASNPDIMSLLASLRKPVPISTTVNPAASSNLLQPNQPNSLNSMNMLSMLNRPKTTTTSSTSNLANIFSILGQNKQSSSTSSNNIFSSLLSGMSGQNPTGGSSNLLNALSLINKPSTASSTNTKTGNTLNIFSLLNPPNTVVTAAPIITQPPPSNGGSDSMSQIFSLLNPSTSGGSSSSLTNLLLNRLKPTSTAPAAGGMSSLLSQLLGNSPTSSLISNLLSGGTTGSKNKPKPTGTKATVTPSTTRPNVVVPDSISIPVIYETEKRPVPRRTCYPQNCGHRATDGQITHRIVGGQWTGGIEYWPWMASFRRTFFDDDRYIHICGATIISRRWIVTAGHCFMAYKRRGVKLVGQKEKYPSVYAIHAGKYYRDSPEPTMQVFEIESFEAHPEYDFRSLKHDIAVAKLREPIQYSNYVQPACLPGKEDMMVSGERVWVTGWGETLQVGNQNRSKLKELTLPLIGNNKCKSSWPSHFHEAWICTEGAYLEDACAGDSGGPLVKQDEDSRWNLIGIAIAGTRTCSTVKTDIRPGIYTKLAYYRDFIDVATGGACDDEGYKFF
uniref:Chymotrypsin-like protease CTRL-1 n=1 Tax=Phallusia mammillata TaxID=59560 RepID=A0A6F9DA11_9ASCI|nr:chymotrypsin-like protease CTRL-1 [Phallusia mammillata]